MKVSEIKHNHSLTDLLKIIIFSILMLLPFLSIGTRCLYVICNKNAYQSYSGTQEVYYKQETLAPSNVVNTKNDLEQENYYHLYINNNDYQYQAFEMFGLDDFSFEIISGEILFPLSYYDAGFEGEISKDITYLMYISNTEFETYLYVDIGSNYAYFTANDYYKLDCIIKLVDYVPNSNNTSIGENAYIEECEYYIETYEENEITLLDNVFDYSVDQMTNSPTFNWTQNTALYTGVKGMTDNLQVQTNLIAVLIVYWTILTIIYIILDIVLKMFEWLTHGLVKKS